MDFGMVGNGINLWVVFQNTNLVNTVLDLCSLGSKQESKWSTFC